ncbi:MAG TPA: arginine--tRNA ligase [Candidatus Polarisedimenticolaceae bacterium]
MRFASPESAFREGLRRAAMRACGIDPASIPLAYPPSPVHGDLASPLCFELAKLARKAPRALADAIVAAWEPVEGIARLEVAGPGYLNAFLDRAAYLRAWLVETPAGIGGEAGKIVVEHTNINPNKAAHIGHLRNAVLGDTLVRFLSRLGRRVEVQNYIDDTGVQVADLVVGFRVLRGEELAQVRERYAEQTLAARGERFDYIAWDLYAEVTRYYEEDAARLAHRAETLHLMEQGGNPVAELAAHVAKRMVRHHLATMFRLGVRYDVLPKESEILSHRFWEDAFGRLRAAGAVHRVEGGKHDGCWVMDLPGVEQGAGEDQKIIVRSNGTVTYVGKDIAYQMWKFGLLGRDFDYAPFDWGSDAPLYPLWETVTGGDGAAHPAFGHAHTVYNVIDTRQSYLQRVVAQGLRALGHGDEAERSIHFAYEMVALTPAAVQHLFPDYPLTEEERAKPYLEMSGRKGLGVRADDLVDALLARAEDEVRKRNPDQEAAKTRETARRIAVGALRYYMLRFSRNRVVAFDLDDALAFEGETGPYLQYSVVRARNILAKLGSRRGLEETDAAWLQANADFNFVPESDRASHWEIPALLGRLEAVLEQAVSALELAAVAKHAYVLAQTFNSFYHRWPVAQEEDAGVRRARAAVVRLYHDGMVHLLGLMGIEVPERM